MLAEDPKSTSTAYLYKLTSYGTTQGSWVWTQHLAVGIQPLLSTDDGTNVFLACGSKVWRFNWVSGKMHLVYRLSDPSAVIETVTPCGYTGRPYISYVSDSTRYRLFWENNAPYLSSCESFHYINAYSSNAEIGCNKEIFRHSLKMCA